MKMGLPLHLKKMRFLINMIFEAFYNESFSDYIAFINQFYQKYLTAYALTLSISLPMLSTHNIYLVQDTENTFSAVGSGTMPLKFPMYIYYPSYIDDTFNVNGSTTLNIMVRVPNLSFNASYWSPLTIERMRCICLKHLADLLEINSIAPYIIHESMSTPRDLQQKFNCYQGAAFGLAPSILQSAWLHPQPICPFVTNLYFTGTSIHPGNGISIVMEGAKTVSNLIQSSYPLNLKK